MRSIRDLDLNNKKVIVRCDFNVPIKDGVIEDDYRIVQTLPTLQYILDNNGIAICLSHLGKVKKEKDLNQTLIPVAERLSELLNRKVYFVNKTRGASVNKLIKSLKPGDICLLENTRFEDINDGLESTNDYNLGHYWSTLGDVFINDAFGASHRAHASVVGIKQLPKAAGFLVEKEVAALSKIINEPKHPLVLIMGGAKINDKIKLINKLIEKVDYLLIGSGMALPFLKTLGFNVESPLIDEENLEMSKELLEKHRSKIILPIDVITTKNLKDIVIENKSNDEIKANDIVLDIGDKTITRYESFLSNAKMVVWNGPLGIAEYEEGKIGTVQILKFLAYKDLEVIIGGGDTAAVVSKLGMTDNFTHVSTGGGATLEYLEGNDMPGLDILREGP